ncbi:MAG: hypothetical protein NTX45_14235 [Proteobacteria bacterium]|nr:hypothetical protein [Pseudomonadota bacterium]
MENNELREYNNNNDFDIPTEGRHRKHGHRHSTKRRWVYILLVVLFIETIILAGVLIWGTKLEEENRGHFAKEKELAMVIKDEKTELEAQRWEFNKLKSEQAKTCLPNLMSLKFDKVLEINNEYVKSGIFMLTGKKDKKYLEFKIILQNNTHDNIVPKVDVLFFNATGNQVGLTQIGYLKDEPAPTREILEKGEVRSYDGNFEIDINYGQPEYIMIKTKNAK